MFHPCVCASTTCVGDLLHIWLCTPTSGAAAAQPLPQGPAPLGQLPTPLDQPPAPEGSGYSQVPSGYGVQQIQELTNSQSATGGLYQDHHGYEQHYSQQIGTQQGYGAPPTPGHVTVSQGHMTGAPPSQGHVTAPQGLMTLPSQGHVSAPQGHMTGAPPSQGQAYASPGPSATAGYAMMTPVAPQQYAEPQVPPSSQNLQQTDLGQEQDEDEDPGKGENSSKTVSNTSNVPFICGSLCVPIHFMQASGGVMHFFRNLFPKKGGVHLPDDKPETKKVCACVLMWVGVGGNSSYSTSEHCTMSVCLFICLHVQIVWDPEKKKWIDKESGEEV